jgi:hypothetical protein
MLAPVALGTKYETRHTSLFHQKLVSPSRFSRSLIVIFSTKGFLTVAIADKTKYMVMSRDRHARRGESVKIDNSSIERGEEFKYLGTTLRIKILFRKKLRAD